MHITYSRRTSRNAWHVGRWSDPLGEGQGSEFVVGRRMQGAVKANDSGLTVARYLMYSCVYLRDNCGPS